jgi:protein-tyrosine phosphatase
MTQPLNWPECRNARDVGGLPTVSGRPIRTRALIRTDRLDLLNVDGLAAVDDYGVSRIVDLRSVEEITDAPGPFAADARYRHEPFIDPDGGPFEAPTLVEAYQLSVVRNARRIAACVAAVAEAPAGGVLVHCAAGKDRTGMLVAMLLHAVGVPLSEVAADYGRSTEGLRSRYEAELAAEPDATKRERLRDRQSSHPDTILATMAYLEDAYGATLDYLTAIGVTPQQIGALRARLVDD